jgi:hypothetical protein
MANELNNMVKSAAEKVAGYVKDAACMTVETRFIDLDGSTGDYDQSKPAARTVIRLDGDCSSVVPVRHTADGAYQIDEELFSLHERNVSTAIDYRSRMMEALLQLLR